jgi:dihydrodiol dehydrogenase / D-xylose 1-dehydrogenase (NADP)
MISWGIIGTGNIANQFANDFKYVTKGTLVGVASRSKSKAIAFSNKYGIEKTYDSYEAIVKDPSIDIVYIATPHTFHKEHTLLALNHNKHVLCEKPFAVNESDVKDMIQLAKKKNLFLMEAMWMVFQPVFKQVQKWISEDKIGKIKTIKAEFGFQPPYDLNSRLYNIDLAGGTLLDIGIYPLTLALYLLNKEPIDIQAMASIGKSKVDEQLSVNLKFAPDQMAMLSSSFMSKFKDDAFIYGEKGYIHIPNFWYSKKASLVTKTETVEYENTTPIYGYANEIEHVNEMLLKGKTESNIVTFAKSKQLIKNMDLIRDQIGLKYPFEG